MIEDITKAFILKTIYTGIDRSKYYPSCTCDLQFTDRNNNDKKIIIENKNWV
jgi:hypothetical protein